jgi:sugar lactone lactonase YvrE
MNAQNVSRFKFFHFVFIGFLAGAFLWLPNVSAEESTDSLISITRNAADQVEIKFIGILQSAGTVIGPWADELGESPKQASASGTTRYYRIKPFELPVAAHFSVNLQSGIVDVSSESPLLKKEDLRAAAVYAGSTIGFNSSVVVDEAGGSPSRKVLSVSLVNHGAETVGADPNGVLSGIKVVFDQFSNLSTPSDLRLQSMVSTLAGTGASGSTDGAALSATFVNPAGVTTGPDGSIYICDSFANKVRKLSGNQVFTLAGSGAAASTDGIGTTASFNLPWGVAYSATLNGLVIADRNGRRIRLLTFDGVVSTIAGTGAASSTEGTGDVATLNVPIAVAVDGAGTIYVGEYPGQKIRKITLTGINTRVASSYTVSTWAGSGVGGAADGIGTAAQFNRILGLAAEQDGTLYVADASNFKIRRVSPAREVVTIAGGLVSGSVNGSGIVAKFKSPAGIALLNGSVAVLDSSDNTVRWMTLTPGGTAINPADWQVRTLAGAGSPGATDGRGDVAQFNSPFAITPDGDGNLIVADYSNAKLRKVTPTAGYFPVGVPAATSVTEPVRLSNAEGVYEFTTAGGATSRPFISYDEAVLPGGTSSAQEWAFEVPKGVNGFEFNVTVMAPSPTKVPLGVVSNPGPTGAGSSDVLVRTIAGNGASGYVNGRGTAARFNNMRGIAVDREGNLYVADGFNHAIRRVSRDGIVSTIAGGLTRTPAFVDGYGDAAKFNSPAGIAVSRDGKTLYVADNNNNAIRRMNLYGVDPASPGSWYVATIAGTSVAAAYVDNTTGTAARFNAPYGIAWAPGDTLYVTEYAGNRVRLIQPQASNLDASSSWYVSLIAGDTSAAAGATGTTEGNGSFARFNSPDAVAVDQADFIYVADSGNHRIRKIDQNGDVSTLAGSTFGYADGTGGSAQMIQPSSIAVDSAGYLYVAEYSHRIRRVSPAGIVTTVAGTGATFPGDIDGSGDVATFYYPQGIAVDAAGTLYVTSGGTYLFSGGGGSTSPGIRIRMIQRILR